MKFGVVGGGAVGLLFSAYLLENQRSLTLYTRTKEQADLLKSKGLTLHKNSQVKKYSLNSSPFLEDRLTEDFLIITVKQYQLRDVIEMLSKIKKRKTILFVQNGMGHIQLLTKIKHHNILLGVVEHGALRHSACEIEHTGIGQVKVSALNNHDYKVPHFKSVFVAKDFPISVENDWYEMVAKKLVANAVINPLTTLYRVKNGGLLENHLIINMKALFEEVFTVIDLAEKQEVWEQVLSICRNTSRNQSSMLKDVKEGRKTEVDAILGFLLEQASKRNKSMPLTEFLFQSIKSMEGSMEG